MRNLECKDREHVLRSDDAELVKAFELHAARCTNCAQELRLWREISVAARDLRKDWESPHLWPRIQKALEGEAERQNEPRGLPALWATSFRWAPAAALATLLILVGASGWVLIHRLLLSPNPEAERRLLTEDAMREVEKSEASYQASIEKLSKLAAPRVESPQTPLQAAYREKLSVLDAAIDECRAQVNRNPANPHLRRQLLAMYREKQSTLEHVLREE